ncbi:MAG: ATP-dependent protease [Candidatus Thermochlorobacter aerophilum]|jgi:ATP-dependent Lon protease|uniref:ATP-dependent protease n=1 Tax=Candidatus Thermochlorobacter aerophilus TaxID=1868324 RepID=A0A395M3I4_9BACT|nr:MAG: ATP-dependent protease [Candidatus Thermochlorobacter aerophilum]RFM25511.1 MAG: ATP-dependent protease [Candidatus Thermochlorobacter aerophilum]
MKMGLKMAEKRIIPLFPLPLVVCPEETLPLHIFEERYKAMIAYCRKERQPFGVSLAYNNKLYSVGCTVELEEIVNEYPDGRLDIITVGVMRYRMLETYKDKPYLRAAVEFFDDDGEPVDPTLRQRVITLHLKFIELLQGETTVEDYDFHERVSFRVAHSAGFDVLQKQKVLEMTNENKRLEMLIEHFEKIIPDIERTEEIKRRVRSNGHFKNLRSFDL